MNQKINKNQAVLATTSTDGYISSTDWNTFNGKQPLLVSGTNIKTINSNSLLGAGDISVATLIGYTPYNATNPANYITLTSLSNGTGISYNNLTGVITNSSPDQTVVLSNGTGISVTGTYPSFTITNTGVTSNGGDWAGTWQTFSPAHFQTALTIGNLTDVGTDGITVTGGTGAVIGTGTSISQQVADTTHNGYLSSTDWNTFNGKQPAGTYLTGTLTATRVPFASGASTLTDSANMTYVTNRLSPTYITLAAGTATAGTAPLKLTTGVNLATPEDGAIEYNGVQLYYTGSSTVRQTLIPAAYGSMYENNTGGTAITLTTAGTYYGWVTATTEANKLTTFNHNATADNITISTGGDGDYLVSAGANFSVSNAGITYTMAIYKNGSIVSSLTTSNQNNNTANLANLSINGIITGLIATNTVDVRFSTTVNNRTVTVYQTHLTLTRINR